MIKSMKFVLDWDLVPEKMGTLPGWCLDMVVVTVTVERKVA